MKNRCGATRREQGRDQRCGREVGHREKSHRWVCVRICPHTQCASQRARSTGGNVCGNGEDQDTARMSNYAAFGEVGRILPAVKRGTKRAAE